MAYKILVVDDEAAIVDMIETFLINFDYKVLKGYSSKDAFALMDDNVDLLLLDIALEDDNDAGFSICKKIRNIYNIPIIFLSAKTSSIDQMQGFNVGADDYITKPFDLMILASRIKANLRRVNDYDLPKESDYTIKNLSLNPKLRRVFINDEEIVLSKKEYDLLEYLFKCKGEILSRKELLKNVWKSSHYDLNTVNTFIMRLRKKLNRSNESYIQTIHGRGYSLVDN